jgi:hypothetical protein
MSIERAFFRVVRILFIRGDARGASRFSGHRARVTPGATKQSRG